MGAHVNIIIYRGAPTNIDVRATTCIDVRANILTCAPISVDGRSSIYWRARVYIDARVYIEARHVNNCVIDYESAPK